MNNIIQNKKVVVPIGIDLNDKDYLNSMNSLLKEMIKNYAVILTEVSNKYLLKEYKKIFDNLIILQRQTFDLIFENGWYTLEKAEKNKIDNKFSTLNSDFTDLSIEE